MSHTADIHLKDGMTPEIAADLAERKAREIECPVCHWTVYKDQPGPDGKILDHGNGQSCAGVQVPNPGYWDSWESQDGAHG